MKQAKKISVTATNRIKLENQQTVGKRNQLKKTSLYSKKKM